MSRNSWKNWNQSKKLESGRIATTEELEEGKKERNKHGSSKERTNGTCGRRKKTRPDPTKAGRKPEALLYTLTLDRIENAPLPATDVCLSVCLSVRLYHLIRLHIIPPFIPTGYTRLNGMKGGGRMYWKVLVEYLFNTKRDTHTHTPDTPARLCVYGCKI